MNDTCTCKYIASLVCPFGLKVLLRDDACAVHGTRAPIRAPLEKKHIVKHDKAA